MLDNLKWMYTNRLPILDFQRQLMGRRDTGRPRRRWKEQDISSFKGTGSRTYSLDTFVMVVVTEREKALDMLHTECHESASFCFYRLSERYSVSRLVAFTRFRKYETTLRPRIYEMWIIYDISHCLWLRVCNKSGGWWHHVILCAKWQSDCVSVEPAGLSNHPVKRSTYRNWMDINWARKLDTAWIYLQF